MPDWSWWDDQVGEESELRRVLERWGAALPTDLDDANYDRKLACLVRDVVDGWVRHREGGQGGLADPPLVVERAERISPGGAWKVELMAVRRGIGHDAAGVTCAQAVAGALRRVAEAEGFPPGLCCGCGRELSHREARTGAVAHGWCVGWDAGAGAADDESGR